MAYTPFVTKKVSPSDQVLKTQIKFSDFGNVQAVTAYMSVSSLAAAVYQSEDIAETLAKYFLQYATREIAKLITNYFSLRQRYMLYKILGDKQLTSFEDIELNLKAMNKYPREVWRSPAVEISAKNEPEFSNFKWTDVVSLDIGAKKWGMTDPYTAEMRDIAIIFWKKKGVKNIYHRSRLNTKDFKHIAQILENKIVLGYNILSYDLILLNRYFNQYHIKPPKVRGVIDALRVARQVMPATTLSQESLARLLKVKFTNAHDTTSDAEAVKRIFEKLIRVYHIRVTSTIGPFQFNVPQVSKVALETKVKKDEGRYFSLIGDDVFFINEDDIQEVKNILETFVTHYPSASSDSQIVSSYQSFVLNNATSLSSSAINDLKSHYSSVEIIVNEVRNLLSQGEVPVKTIESLLSDITRGTKLKIVEFRGGAQGKSIFALKNYFLGLDTFNGFRGVLLNKKIAGRAVRQIQDAILEHESELSNIEIKVYSYNQDGNRVEDNLVNGLIRALSTGYNSSILATFFSFKDSYLNQAFWNGFVTYCSNEANRIKGLKWPHNRMSLDKLRDVSNILATDVVMFFFYGMLDVIQVKANLEIMVGIQQRVSKMFAEQKTYFNRYNPSSFKSDDMNIYKQLRDKINDHELAARFIKAFSSFRSDVKNLEKSSFYSTRNVPPHVSVLPKLSSETTRHISEQEAEAKGLDLASRDAQRVLDGDMDASEYISKYVGVFDEYDLGDDLEKAVNKSRGIYRKESKKLNISNVLKKLIKKIEKDPYILNETEFGRIQFERANLRDIANKKFSDLLEGRISEAYIPTSILYSIYQRLNMISGASIRACYMAEKIVNGAPIAETIDRFYGINQPDIKNLTPKVNTTLEFIPKTARTKIQTLIGKEEKQVWTATSLYGTGLALAAFTRYLDKAVKSIKGAGKKIDIYEQKFKEFEKEVKEIPHPAFDEKILTSFFDKRIKRSYRDIATQVVTLSDKKLFNEYKDRTLYPFVLKHLRTSVVIRKTDFLTKVKDAGFKNVAINKGRGMITHIPMRAMGIDKASTAVQLAINKKDPVARLLFSKTFGNVYYFRQFVDDFDSTEFLSDETILVDARKVIEVGKKINPANITKEEREKLLIENFMAHSSTVSSTSGAYQVWSTKDVGAYIRYLKSYSKKEAIQFIDEYIKSGAIKIRRKGLQTPSITNPENFKRFKTTTYKYGEQTILDFALNKALYQVGRVPLRKYAEAVNRGSDALRSLYRRSYAPSPAEYGRGRSYRGTEMVEEIYRMARTLNTIGRGAGFGGDIVQGLYGVARYGNLMDKLVNRDPAALTAFVANRWIGKHIMAKLTKGYSSGNVFANRIYNIVVGHLAGPNVFLSKQAFTGFVKVQDVIMKWQPKAFSSKEFRPDDPDFWR